MHFKYVYLERPDIANNYIDIIKKYFNGKIIYFPHDIHQIRLYREYIIKHNNKIFEKYKQIQIIEDKIFSNVDIIHIVGKYEFNFLKKKYQNKTIRIIPLFFYQKILTNIEKDFSKRKDLIFVGSFSHTPNLDAFLWFSTDIYPKIVEKYPDIILHIVGYNVPHELKKLESKNIKFEGFLSDENLQLLYQNCRIAIAPLRFGAGVKGKILEAIYNQIPIVTTSIGAEGIENPSNTFIIEDNPQKISHIICELYENYSKLKEISDSCKIFIQKYYSKAKAIDIIKKDIT